MQDYTRAQRILFPVIAELEETYPDGPSDEQVSDVIEAALTVLYELSAMDDFPGHSELIEEVERELYGEDPEADGSAPVKVAVS